MSLHCTLMGRIQNHVTTHRLGFHANLYCSISTNDFVLFQSQAFSLAASFPTLLFPAPLVGIVCGSGA